MQKLRLGMLLMILSTVCACSTSPKRKIEIYRAPAVENTTRSVANVDCNTVLEKCTKAVNEQKNYIKKQREVIDRQSDVIEHQAKEVREAHQDTRKAVVSGFSLSTFLLLLLLL